LFTLESCVRVRVRVRISVKVRVRVGVGVRVRVRVRVNVVTSRASPSLPMPSCDTMLRLGYSKISNQQRGYTRFQG